MNREDYERDLKRRQDEHLRSVGGAYDAFWRPCMHNGCAECVGTGVKRDGSSCVHMISCQCPKCSPSCQSLGYAMSDPIDFSTVEH